MTRSASTIEFIHDGPRDCDWRCEERYRAAHDPESDYEGVRCSIDHANHRHSAGVTSCSACQCAVWWLRPGSGRHAPPRACSFRYPAPDDGTCDVDRVDRSPFCVKHQQCPICHAEDWDYHSAACPNRPAHLGWRPPKEQR